MGYLITVEGLDGCGKSTLIKKLGIRSFREPGGTAIGETIRMFLKGEPGQAVPAVLSERSRRLAEQIATESPGGKLLQALRLGKEIPSREGLDSASEVYLFNIARSELVHRRLLPALAKGDVVLDRFIDSTVAYQGYGRGLDPDWVREVSLTATGGLLPDLTLLLVLDEAGRTVRMNRGLDPIESSGGEFFSRVRKGFEEIRNAEPSRVRAIDASAPPDQVHLLSAEEIRRLKEDS